LASWFQSAVIAPAANNNITVRLKMLPFFNILRQFAPPSNYAKECAYMDGADFFYRVNDDNELLTPWATAFVRALANLSPPFVGMVGPADPHFPKMRDPRLANKHDERAHVNMVIDFTHRTHHLIHGIHYPVIFSDWWTDGWINRVYLPDNTRVVTTVLQRHHSEETRYHIDSSHSIWMIHELDKGIRRTEVIALFLSDCPDDLHVCNGRLARPSRCCCSKARAGASWALIPTAEQQPPTPAGWCGSRRKSGTGR
jgi:hypothetical protein